MNAQRLLIAALWIVTVTAAYFIGSGGNSAADRTPPAAHAGGAGMGPGGPGASAGDAANAGEAKKVARQFGDTDEVGPNGKRTVKSLVARVRAEFSGGMNSMMNMRGMMRAFAPLLELNDAEVQEALKEVELTVTETQPQMMLYSLLLSQWAEKDGEAAMTFAKGKMEKNKMYGGGMEMAVIGTWAKSNPEAAWKWFEREGKNEGADPMRGMPGMTASMLFAGMAANNLDTALARLETLDPQTKVMALNGISGSATNANARQRLLERAATMTPELRNQVQNTLASQWAMAEPDEAVKWMRSLPADQQPGAREAVGNSLLMSKPELAGDVMLEGKTTPEDRGRVYDQIAGRWGYQDPKAAGEWLSKQPQGPELDGARRTYAMAVSSRDPVGAMEWAKSVQNPDQRDQSVMQIFQMWRGRDAAAAEAGLKGSGLTPEKIQEALSLPMPEKAPTASPGATRVIGR